ncbi:MAG: prepilin-type N-terminal cleavage/methylation domain-containing protein [Candidatus Pacebacteria bacterium]|nr:prepilin-type N-terminal cleavage/methylation domain-containing protein [Candidatus Paceibacterota bacterium]
MKLSTKIQVTSYKSAQSGFTLVETLVAIAILMVAIAGPLTVANKALTAALGSRNAMIATYLAQEGMESIKSIKDNNAAILPANWLNGLNESSCTTACTTPDATQLFLGDDTAVGIIPCTATTYSECQMNVSNISDYYYPSIINVNGAYKVTPFVRYFFISPVTNPSNNPNERIVTVVVAWSDGSVPNEIRLKELITNIPR